MVYINITTFVLINWLEKDQSMIQMRRLKNVIFILAITELWTILFKYLTNTYAKIPTVTFFAQTILFTLALAFINIPLLIWIKCWTIEFAFTIAWYMFYQCLILMYSCYHSKYFSICVFCFSHAWIFI